MAAQRIDARGNLVVPGLEDAHIHLAKAFLLAKALARTGNFAEALAETYRLKEGYTVKNHKVSQFRARVVLDRAIGISNYGIEPGCRGDLVILEAASPSEAIATASVNRTVFKVETGSRKPLYCRSSGGPSHCC